MVGKAVHVVRLQEPRRLVEEGIRLTWVREKSWPPGDEWGGSLGSGPALGWDLPHGQWGLLVILAGGVPKTSYVCQPSCFILR